MYMPEYFTYADCVQCIVLLFLNKMTLMKFILTSKCVHVCLIQVTVKSKGRLVSCMSW